MLADWVQDALKNDHVNTQVPLWQSRNSPGLENLYPSGKGGKGKEREEGSRGSLTSLAKQVFLPHIEMQVLNAQLAFLEMNLLVLAVAGIVDGTLPLVRRVAHGGGVRMGAPVDAVGGGR